MRILITCANQYEARMKYLAAQMLLHGKLVRATEHPRGVYKVDTGRAEIVIDIVALDLCNERTFTGCDYDLLLAFALPTDELVDQAIRCCNHGKII